MSSPRNPDAKAELERLLRERKELREKHRALLDEALRIMVRIREINVQVDKIRRAHGSKCEN